MSNFAVTIEDMTVAYQNEPVLWDVDINIPNGVLAAIIGPNGAGKSTFIKGALGIIKPLSGVIRFFDAPYKEVYKKIGYVPQKEAVNWQFPTTVLDVVVMGRYGSLGWVKRPKKNDYQLASRALERIGMAQFAERQISELSGGQQQRVFIARALVQDADIYFMDEPFAGVDNKTEKIIIDILREFRERGKTVIVVHHDLATVPEYFDYVVMLNKEAVAQGNVETTFTPENLHRTYQNITEAGDNDV